ncbi:MAG TPA: hypothetical protein PKD46_17135 [Aggregatilineaceae bacterium]|nr:hypothetical protein [Aggregatilineaceae bacterium]
MSYKVHATPKLVAIHWLDANAINGWQDPDDKDTTVHEAVTVGWLVREDKVSVTVSSTIAFAPGEDKYEINAAMTIPRGMIVKQRVMR